jgi:hypothetical protein
MILSKVFRIIAFLVIVYVSGFSITTYRCINKDEPISYSILSTKEQKWRGASYVLYAVFNESVYKVNVTKSDFSALENEVKPKLYYNSLYNQIVNAKTLQLSIGILLGLLFLVIMVEWQLRRKRRPFA